MLVDSDVQKESNLTPEICKKSQHFVCIAPMLDYTDRHARFFLRLISANVRLYTEMITAHAIKYGNIDYLLSYSEVEKPLALQLGGSDQEVLVQAALIGEDYGYDEINLNVGCPSNRVKAGNFGACLMLRPNRVAECIAAMQSQVAIPVTVKCRIGVDNHDSYENLHQFIDIISRAGCQTFIIHARKAWLSGLSPRENREIPPLHYETVYKIKRDFPNLTIVINGGITNLAAMKEHVKYIDGIMIGRAACYNPYLLSQIQNYFFEDQLTLTREQIVESFIAYAAKQCQQGMKLASLIRPLLGLFYGQRGGAIWRRLLSENTQKTQTGVELIRQALLEMNKMRQLC